jgi:hypothetical protein
VSNTEDQQYREHCLSVQRSGIYAAQRRLKKLKSPGKFLMERRVRT